MLVVNPICKLRWPRESEPECGQRMVSRRNLAGTDELFVCPVHDGSAASAYRTNPSYNKPRPETTK